MIHHDHRYFPEKVGLLLGYLFGYDYCPCRELPQTNLYYEELHEWYWVGDLDGFVR